MYGSTINGIKGTSVRGGSSHEVRRLGAYTRFGRKV